METILETSDHLLGEKTLKNWKSWKNCKRL